MSRYLLGAAGLLVLLALLVLPGSSCGPVLDRDDDDAESDDDDATPLVGDTFDILMVVDNSNSMARIHEELQDAFPELLQALTTSGASWQLGVTTTDIDNGGAGNQGNLRGSDPVGSEPCGFELVTSDMDPVAGGDLFRDLVDVGVAGATDEKGVYAAALALCKGQDAAFWVALDGLPDDDPVKRVCQVIPQDHRSCNEGAFRPDTPTVVITVSDEGDDTERLEFLPPPSEVDACVLEHNDDPTFGECACRLDWWEEFFAAIGQRVVFVTVGPTYQPGSDPVLLCDGSTTSYAGPCNPFGSVICSLDFYQQIACHTGGRFFPVEETSVVNDPVTCDIADLSGLADELRQLLTGVAE